MCEHFLSENKFRKSIRQVPKLCNNSKKVEKLSDPSISSPPFCIHVVFLVTGWLSFNTNACLLFKERLHFTHVRTNMAPRAP